MKITSEKIYDIILKCVLFIMILNVVIAVIASVFKIKTVMTGVIVMLYLIWLIAVIMFFGLFIHKAVEIIKKGVYNIRICDDKTFDEIDKFKKNNNRTKDFYNRIIGVINNYYKKDGEVDKIVQSSQIERLYNRKSFLKAQQSIINDYYSYIVSFGIIIIESYIIDKFDSTKSVILISSMAAFIFLSITIFYYKYSQRKDYNKYLSFVNEYEQKLLEKKIQSIEKKCLIAQEDEKIFHTKNIIIDSLYDLRKKRCNLKEKKKISSNIEYIRKMNLFIDDYNKCYMKEIDINEKKAYLLYDKKNEKPKASEWEKLYKILVEYGFINS